MSALAREAIKEYLGRREGKVISFASWESGQWPDWQDQYSRTSDRHLVYCQHYYHENLYAFLNVFEPHAHDEARDYRRMFWLIDVAKDFHEQF